MDEQRYIHSSVENGVELNRLRLVEEVYDPTTIRRLEILRPSEGWKCLEVGAGAGSVARWLAVRVGPAGKAVATDIDVRFLSQISTPNLEIRRNDIIKDELEAGQYDLVHCRLLLMHLSEPEKALERMANALRPGGWLLVEDQDYGSVVPVDLMHPFAGVFTSTYGAGLDFLRKRGILDPYFGRRLRGLVEGLGFTDLGQEGWTRVNRGGEPAARLSAMTVQAGSKPMIAAGVLTKEQHDAIHSLFLDPTFQFVGPMMFAAWGRRPRK